MTALNLKKNEGLSGNDPPPFTIINNNNKTKKFAGQEKKHPFPCPGGRLMF